MKSLKLILATSAVFVSVVVHAQTATPQITKQQVQQRHRIQNGVKSGTIDTKEARMLRAKERKLQFDKHRFKKDGEVSKRERVKLNRETKRTSKAIYKSKHN